MTHGKYWQIGVGISGLLIVYWLTLGLPLADVVQVTVLTAYQITLGAMIWRLCFPLAPRSIFTDIGMGFAVGALMFVAVRQISIAIGINHLLPVGTISVAIVAARSWSTSPTRVGLMATLHQPSGYPVAIVLTAFGSLLLGARQFIPQTRFTAAVILLFLGLALSLRPDGFRLFGRWGHYFVIFLTFIMLISSLSYSPKSVPKISKILQLFYSGSDDVLFSEALAFTLDRFGPYEHTVGDIVSLKYHWLSLAWSGLMQRSADLEPLAMSTVIAPSIGYVVILAIVMSCLEQVGHSISMPLFAAIAMFFSSIPGADFTTIFVENTSNIFGHIWLFAAVNLILVKTPRKRRAIWLRLLLLAIFGGATGLAKAPYAVVLIVVLSARAIFSLFRNRTVKLNLEIGEAVAVCVGALLTYLLFLRQPDWSPLGYEFGVRSLTRIDSPYAVGLAITVTLILIRLSPLCATFKRFRLVDLAALFPLMIGVPAALSLDLISNSNSDTYFLNAALAVACLGLAPVFNASWIALRSWHTVQGVSIAAAALLVSIPILLLESNVSNRLSLTQKLLFCLLGLLGLGVIRQLAKYIGGKNHAPTTTPRLLVVFGVIVILFVGVGGRAAQTGEIPRRLSMPSDEIFKVMSVIRGETPHDAIVATNLGICGIECLTHPYDRMVVPALAHRHVVNYWPRLGPQLNLPDWQIQRTRLSFLFANEPTKPHAKVFTDLGATHFLVDMTLANNNCSTYEASSAVAVIFSDERWCLLEFVD